MGQQTRAAKIWRVSDPWIQRDLAARGQRPPSLKVCSVPAVAAERSGQVEALCRQDAADLGGSP